MSWMKTGEALRKLPSLLLQGKVSFDFDGIPLKAEGLPMKKRLNLMKVGINKLFRLNTEIGLPPLLHTELTNVCNLHCPLCPTGSNTLKRPKGFMSEETFLKMLDELGDVLIGVYLFCFGEPFLNKSIVKMIESCTERDILSLTSTNGNCTQTREEAGKIVKAGLSALIIAIDGSTQEIYHAYRKGGEIEKLARDLGVNMFSYKSVGCMVKGEKFNDYMPVEKNMRRFEYSGSSEGRRLTECIFPFRQPIIFWDGTVVGCEYDHNMDYAFGKISERSFADIWNSPPAVELRKNIRKRQNKTGFCSQCPYEGRSREGTTLYCRELNPAVR